MRLKWCIIILAGKTAPHHQEKNYQILPALLYRGAGICIQEANQVRTMADEMNAILSRLQELDKMDFPRFRTYKKPDGTWVDRELVPEYLEQAELTRKVGEILDLERYFHREHNPLLVSLRLECLANTEGHPMDVPLLARIARAVYSNSPVA